MRKLVLGFVILAGAVVLGAATGSAQTCTINFEGGNCPNSGAVCNATFSGGLGCQTVGVGNCYQSGVASYRIASGAPLTITFSTAVGAIEAFFAHQGGATASMTFWDSVAGGSQVGSSLSDAGDCNLSKPAMVNRTFTTPIRRIEVALNGTGNAWIDDLTITQATVPVYPSTWGLLKDRYR